MPRELFTTDAPGALLGTRRWYSMPLAVAAHAFGIGVVITVPLLATNAFPTPESVLVDFVMPPKPEVPLAPEPKAPVPQPVVAEPVNVAAAPVEEPKEITPEPITPPKLAVVIREHNVPTATGPVAVALAPPPAKVEEPPAGPLRVGGDIKEPKRIEGPMPAYPLIARASRAGGSVLLEAVIGKDGRVKDVRVTRSMPMFDEAALAAVRQWRYTVPMLNGEPIDVLMTVTVHFGLGR